MSWSGAGHLGELLCKRFRVPALVLRESGLGQRRRNVEVAGIKMLKYPLVSSSNLTDSAISAAVERSVGKAFIQEEMGKHANKIAFPSRPGMVL